MEKKYMDLAIKEAIKSFKKGDVPVGSIIVKKGKVIAKAHNLKEKRGNAICHAEILAIQKACKKLKKWRLEDCIIYTTLEPCLMCYGAILEARINKLVYGASSTKYGFEQKVKNTFKKNNKIVVIRGIYEKKSQELLKGFFGNKRG